MFSRKILVRILINSAIGIVLIFLWLKLVNVHEVLEVIKTVNPFMVLPIIGFYFLAAIFRALRLTLLLKTFNVPFKKILAVNLLSQLLSFMIPIRAGEIVKGVYLSTEYALPLSKAVIWVFLDRLWDFLVVICLSLLLLFLIPTGLPTEMRQSLAILLMVFIIGGVVTIYIPAFAKKLRDLIAQILLISALKKIFIRLADFIIDTATFFKASPKNTALILLFTFGAIIAETLTWIWLFNVVFNLNEEFIRMLLGTLLNMLTFLIPAAPGYVGSAEAAGLAVFAFGLGMDKILVSAATVIMHVATLLYIIISGLYGVFFLKLDFKQIIKSLKQKLAK